MIPSFGHQGVTVRALAPDTDIPTQCLIATGTSIYHSSTASSTRRRRSATSRGRWTSRSRTLAAGGNASCKAPGGRSHRHYGRPRSSGAPRWSGRPADCSFTVLSIKRSPSGEPQHPVIRRAWHRRVGSVRARPPQLRDRRQTLRTRPLRGLRAAPRTTELLRVGAEHILTELTTVFEAIVTTSTPRSALKWLRKGPPTHDYWPNWPRAPIADPSPKVGSSGLVVGCRHHRRI